MNARSVPQAAGSILAAVVALALGASTGSAQEASRYPYDPVCPWGRLSNGKGMLVRCLTPSEAAALAAPAKAARAPTAATPPSAAPAPAPSAAASAATPAPEPEQVEVALASLVVTPDEGTLPAAQKKLWLAKDRFVACVRDNGGLEKTEGEVRVRFLVRSRGRAEGVSVDKLTGLGRKAADCLANVVDRRWVGTPEAPLVGATGILKFSRLKK